MRGFLAGICDLKLAHLGVEKGPSAKPIAPIQIVVDYSFDMKRESLNSGRGIDPNESVMVVVRCLHSKKSEGGGGLA